MSHSDKGDRRRKRFLYPLGRGASFFLLIYARRKLQPSLGNQKSSHLTAGSFYASGTLRALKTVHWTVFVRRDVPPAYDLRLPHRPAPLGRGLSSATAAPALALCFRRRRRSPPHQAILVPNGAQTAVPSKTSNKKIPRNFVRGILWCTIGDSNPGPTD